MMTSSGFNDDEVVQMDALVGDDRVIQDDQDGLEDYYNQEEIEPQRPMSTMNLTNFVINISPTSSSGGDVKNNDNVDTSPGQDSNVTTEQDSNGAIGQDTTIETSTTHNDEDNLKSKPTTCDIKITNLPTNSNSELESLKIEDEIGVTLTPEVLETESDSSSSTDDNHNDNSSTDSVIENYYAEKHTHDTEYDINNENVEVTSSSEDIVENEGFEKTLTPDDLNEDDNVQKSATEDVDNVDVENSSLSNEENVEDVKCVTCSTELIIVFPSTITQHQQNNNLTEIVIPSKSQTASVSSITMDVGDDLQITPVETSNDNMSLNTTTSTNNSTTDTNTFHSDDIGDENDTHKITVDAMIDEEECVEAVQLEAHTEPEISFDSFDLEEEEEEVFSEDIESDLHAEPLDSVKPIKSCEEPMETPTQTILPEEDIVGQSPISEENEGESPISEENEGESPSSNSQQTINMADLIEEDDCVELVEEAVHEEPMNFDFLDENENDVDNNVTKEDVIEENSFTEVLSNVTHHEPPEGTTEETIEKFQTSITDEATGKVQTSAITTKVVEGYTYKEITEENEEVGTTIESGPPIVCNEFEGGDGGNGVAEWILVDCTQEEVKLFHQHFLTNSNEVKKTGKSSCVLQ